MRKPLIVFAFMVLAQWLVPVISMTRSERVLSDGTVFLFRTVPVDPFDWFRGEYLTLQFELEDIDLFMDDGSVPEVGEPVYVVLGEENGAAMVEAVYPEAPMDGSPFLICNVGSGSYSDSTLFRIDLPFSRYYLEQGNGPRVEDMMRRRDAETEGRPEVFARVRVLDGHGVIEDLIIDDRSVKDLLREEVGNTESAEPSE